MNTKNILIIVGIIVLLGIGYFLFTGAKKDTQQTAALEASAWQWKETQYNNDTTVTPNEPKAFVLSFAKDGRFSATTDCNNVFGNYEVKNNSISFGQMASTKKACPDIQTQEQVFATMLSESNNYLTTSEGNLVLTLKLDSGSMIFTPVAQ